MSCNLSDPELARRLQALGLAVGPINDSTRDVYIRKYKGLIQNKHPAPVSPRAAVSTHPPAPPVPPCKPPPADRKPHEKSPLSTPPPDGGEQPCAAVAVVELLLMSFDNLSHIANDTAFLFPSGEVIVASRAILASQCSKMVPLLYNNEGSAIACTCNIHACTCTCTCLHNYVIMTVFFPSSTFSKSDDFEWSKFRFHDS